MIIIQQLKQTSYTYEQVLSLIKDSHSENKKKGINYSVFSLSLEDFINKTKDAVILIAHDPEQQILLGTQSLFLYDNNSVKWAYSDFLAISNIAKRKGIGTMLINEEKRLCEAYECEYMIANTSIKSKESIKWHLKNGYKIVGYQGASVYTYLFRMQFKHPSKYDNKVYILYSKICSGLKMLLVWNSKGYHRKWVKLLRK